jgi:hypothetical protein
MLYERNRFHEIVDKEITSKCDNESPFRAAVTLVKFTATQVNFKTKAVNLSVPGCLCEHAYKQMRRI